MPHISTLQQIKDFFENQLLKTLQISLQIDERQALTFFNSIEQQVLSFTEFEPFFANNLVGQERQFFFSYQQQNEGTLYVYDFECAYLGEALVEERYFYLFNPPRLILADEKPFAVTPYLAEKAFVSIKLGLHNRQLRIEKISELGVHFRLNPTEIGNLRGAQIDFGLQLGQTEAKTKGVLVYDEDAKNYCLRDYLNNRKVNALLKDYLQKHGQREFALSPIILDLANRNKYQVLVAAHTVAAKRQLAKQLNQLPGIQVLLTGDFSTINRLIDAYDINLVVLDPDVLYMNSWELLAAAESVQLPPNVPMLVVTGLPIPKIPVNLKSATTKLLSKPLHNTLFDKTVINILEHYHNKD